MTYTEEIKKVNLKEEEKNVKKKYGAHKIRNVGNSLKSVKEDFV